MTYKPSGYFEEPFTTQQALREHCADQPPGTVIVRNAVPPGVLIVREFLSPALRQAALDYAASSAAVPATVQDIDAQGDDPRAHRSTIRVTDHIDTTGIDDWLAPLLTAALQNVAAPHYGSAFAWFERPALLRYRSGGHYVPHADADNWIANEKRWQRAVDRDISILLYLDENYEGGDLDFPNFRFRLKPSAGMLICFPSDHRYVHCAHEVTRGERHVLVSWAAKRDTPKVRDEAPGGAIVLPG
jgi:predicted 2-oxoglutarate/Fe(II)-dependent dioxygenase YbiX